MGLGQIQIGTAKDAEEWYYGKVIHTDKELKSLLLNEKKDVRYIGMILAMHADELGLSANTIVAAILSRYNGKGPRADQYGAESAGYADYFMLYLGWYYSGVHPGGAPPTPAGGDYMWHCDGSGYKDPRDGKKPGEK